MLVGLVATFLICGGIYGRVNNSNNSVSDNTSQRRLVPFLAENDTVNIYGGFNFVDYWDLSDFDNTDDSYSYEFEPKSSNHPLNYSRVCPMFYNDDFYYVYEINIYVDELDDNDGFNDALITVDYYDESETVGYFTFIMYSSYSSLSHYVSLNPAYNFYFTSLNPVYAHGSWADIWRRCFTSNANQYVTNYTGYYTFNTNGVLLYNKKISILGSNLFANTNAYSFNFEPSNGFIAYYGRLVYDVQNNAYVYNGNILSSRPANFVYFSNVKILKTDFTALNGSIGVFDFIPSSSPSTFEDMMFTVADTPIYFVSSFLNFEFLGVNLYIALSGLITLLVVIFIIRKIW